MSAQFDWAALAARLLHPTQVAIIEAHRYVGGRLSSVELIRLFGPEAPPLSSLAYHTRALVAHGVLEDAGGRQVRGAREHYYRLAGSA